MFWNKKLKLELAAQKDIVERQDNVISAQNDLLGRFNAEIPLLYKQIQDLNLKIFEQNKLLEVYDHEK